MRRWAVRVVVGITPNIYDDARNFKRSTLMHSPAINKKRTITAAVAAVAGTALATSGGTAFAMTTESQTQTTSTMPHTQSAMQHGQSQAAVDLRVTMNNLLREHVSSSLDVTRGLAGGADQRKIDGAKEAQYANADALAAAVGSIYGGAAQAQFSELFREHIVESNKYAAAVGMGDDAAKQAAATELRVYLDDIATFFSTAIPGLPKQDVYGLLNEHEELINKATDAYKAGDYVQSFQMEREALKQVSRAADALSSGIIATQPNKFD